MMTNPRALGVMRPLGGGDPIPLKKEELLVGRRPKCDIRLDFENVSGKHCQLRYIRGVWHIRDLNSTNGTTLNGQRVSSEQGVMPDDELGVAGHYFQLDYDPVAPSSVIDANHILEGISETPRQRSLMELAGLETEDSMSRHFSSRSGGPADRDRDRRPAGPSSAPATASAPRARPPADEPAELPRLPEPEPTAFTDEDFFAMIREDVTKDDKPRRR